VVPSDVVTGVMLVRFQQKLKAIHNRERRIKKLMEKVGNIKAYGSTSSKPEDAQSSSTNGSGVGSTKDLSTLKHTYPPAVAAAATMVFSAATGPANSRFTANASGMEMAYYANPHAMIPTRAAYLSALELLHNEHFELDLSDESDADEENQSMTAPPAADASAEDINPIGIANAEYWRRSLVASDFAQMAGECFDGTC
jgi:hypothetical protein